ncbi:estrogen receptor beta [Plakobranchus ocellatus]|uniref:Estrogen receptor beta n=1 Tax=Plakobranchus ocellatus TaxID=259542 RepID=A0AAV4ARU5_9GAST|nr:estrogen receptor beta [Plakobranchus ocellatus]
MPLTPMMHTHGALINRKWFVPPQNSSGNKDVHSCVVCGESSDQVALHYSRMLCNGCRAFFKRTIQGKVKLGECKADGRCIVDPNSRKSCKACRFEACKRAGVDSSKVQHPRELPCGNDGNGSFVSLEETALSAQQRQTDTITFQGPSIPQANPLSLLHQHGTNTILSWQDTSEITGSTSKKPLLHNNVSSQLPFTNLDPNSFGMALNVSPNILLYSASQANLNRVNYSKDQRKQDFLAESRGDNQSVSSLAMQPIFPHFYSQYQAAFKPYSGSSFPYSPMFINQRAPIERVVSEIPIKQEGEIASNGTQAVSEITAGMLSASLFTSSSFPDRAGEGNDEQDDNKQSHTNSKYGANNISSFAPYVGTPGLIQGAERVKSDCNCSKCGSRGGDFFKKSSSVQDLIHKSNKSIANFATKKSNSFMIDSILDLDNNQDTATRPSIPSSPLTIQSIDIRNANSDHESLARGTIEKVLPFTMNSNPLESERKSPFGLNSVKTVDMDICDGKKVLEDQSESLTNEEQAKSPVRSSSQLCESSSEELNVVDFTTSDDSNHAPFTMANEREDDECSPNPQNDTLDNEVNPYENGTTCKTQPTVNEKSNVEKDEEIADLSPQSLNQSKTDLLENFDSDGHCSIVKSTGPDCLANSESCLTSMNDVFQTNLNPQQLLTKDNLANTNDTDCEIDGGLKSNNSTPSKLSHQGGSRYLDKDCVNAATGVNLPSSGDYQTCTVDGPTKEPTPKKDKISNFQNADMKNQKTPDKMFENCQSQLLNSLSRSSPPRRKCLEEIPENCVSEVPIAKASVASDNIRGSSDFGGVNIQKRRSRCLAFSSSSEDEMPKPRPKRFSLRRPRPKYTSTPMAQPSNQHRRERLYDFHDILSICGEFFQREHSSGETNTNKNPSSQMQSAEIEVVNSSGLEAIPQLETTFTTGDVDSGQENLTSPFLSKESPKASPTKKNTPTTVTDTGASSTSSDKTTCLAQSHSDSGVASMLEVSGQQNSLALQESIKSKVMTDPTYTMRQFKQDVLNFTRLNSPAVPKI